MAEGDERMRAMVEAAVTAAMAALRTNEQKKRPELPEFDPAHIDIWIKRVEAAYVRANIQRPQDKFAFLENKFPVDKDPTINEFLYGESTEARWQSFLSYLRDRYGRSLRHECKAFMRGFQRDGRRPTDMLVHIRDQTRKVTIDALQKEMILTSLPADIQRAMADKVESLDASATATLADSYFDKDGKVLVPSATINAINDARLEDDDDQFDDNDINAISGRQRQQPRHSNASKKPFKRPSSGKTTPGSASSSAATGKRTDPEPLKPTCWRHQRFGDKAKDCQEGCASWDKFQKRQGNGSAGSR